MFDLELDLPNWDILDLSWKWTVSGGGHVAVATFNALNQCCKLYRFHPKPITYIYQTLYYYPNLRNGLLTLSKTNKLLCVELSLLRAKRFFLDKFRFNRGCSPSQIAQLSHILQKRLACLIWVWDRDTSTGNSAAANGKFGRIRHWE